MTFLPIVERELRVAARKRSTSWSRVAAAAVTLVICGGVLVLSSVARAPAASFGGMLFNVVTWLGLVATLCAGLFFTADCLSEEKREGTLGFLFLTDLHGYDIVLGKLLATSLRAFYALLAALPILGVTLLMGGVTGGQFWKTSLALVHGLFFSLTVGLVISAISRDSQKALAGTFCLLLLLAGGGPLADWVQAQITGHPFRPVSSLLSPVFLFILAGTWGGNPYWFSLLLGQSLVWLLLGLGFFLIPRTWQATGTNLSGAAGTRIYAWKYGGRKRREILRHRWLDLNPVLWLACRERWQGLSLLLLALVVAGGSLALLLSIRSPQLVFALSSCSSLLNLACYLWITSQACRFFVDARRSGLIELLLTSPLDAQRIVQGQWRALWLMFGFPVILLLLAQVVTTCAGQEIVLKSNTAGPASAGSNLALSMVTGVSSVFAVVANLVALSWFGMWTGLTSKNASMAILKTFAFVQVIPWLVISFLSSLILILLVMPPIIKSGGGPVSTTIVARISVWFPLLSACLTALLSVGKDVGFFLWARKRLYARFREQASLGGSHASASSRMAISPIASPLASPPVAVPPLIRGPS